MIEATLSILCLIGMGPICGPGGDDEPSIKLTCRADAAVRGQEILLRDIATVDTADRRLIERLMNVSFGKRPAYGYSRILTKNDILLRLVRTGVQSKDLKIVGAEQIVVQPVTVRLIPADLLAVADPILEAAIQNEPNPDIIPIVRGKLRSLRVPPGRIAMDLEGSLHGGKLGQTSARVDVTITVDDELFKVVRISYDLKRFYKVLVVKHAIKAEEPLTMENLAFERIEAPFGPSRYLTTLEQIKGQVARRLLRGRQRLTLGDLAMPSVIHKGDILHLVAQQGRIKVTTRVRALQNGSIGQTIQVVNMGYGRTVRTFLAKVYSPNVVIIQ